MKLKIDSRDLQYTIDTYGLFTGDSTEEMESDHYLETYKLTDDEWRSLGFNYNHSDIVKELADASINLLSNNVINKTDGIVRSIDFIKSGSPQFYNYTTDWYVATWDINSVKLKLYIREHEEAFKKWLSESSWYDSPHKLEPTIDGSKNPEHDPEYLLTAMLDFYTSEEYDPEQYKDSMLELETEIYFNNMELDEESQKLIDSKEKVEA